LKPYTSKGKKPQSTLIRPPSPTIGRQF